jgi:hypothetical protein
VVVVSRADPLNDARKLLALNKRSTPGSCAWCGTRLRVETVPDGAWPVRRRYCGTACRELAARVRRDLADTTPSLPVVLCAVALSGAELRVTDTRAALRDTRDADLKQAVARHSRAIAKAVWRARTTMMLYSAVGGSSGTWLCCTACGEGQFVGRVALGRRCAVTASCPGVLAITVEPGTSAPGRRMPG